jgi:hypothetical protein
MRRSLHLRKKFHSSVFTTFLRTSYTNLSANRLELICEDTQKNRCRNVGRGGLMRDVIFLVLTGAFFLVSIGYVRFCDRLR